MNPSRPRVAHRLLNQRGVTALEFALVMPLLLLATLGAIDIGMETMMDASLENGAAQAARQGVVVGAPPAGETRDQQIYAAVWQQVGFWLQSQSQLTMSSYTYPSYTALSQDPCLQSGYTGACTGSSGSGGFGSIVRYQVTVTRPTFTGVLGLLKITSYTLQRTVIVQNEPESIPS